MTALILAAWLTTVAIAAYAIRSHSATISELKCRVLIQQLEVRKHRRAVRDTEAALRLAMAVLRETPVPYVPVDAETPLHDELAAVRALREELDRWGAES